MKSGEGRKRAEERMEVALPIEFKRRDKTIYGQVKNLSRGGMYVHTKKPLNTNSEEIFTISTAGGAVRFNVPGRVVWNRISPGKAVGMGVRFVENRYFAPEMVQQIVGGLLAQA